MSTDRNYKQKIKNTNSVVELKKINKDFLSDVISTNDRLNEINVLIMSNNSTASAQIDEIVNLRNSQLEMLINERDEIRNSLNEIDIDISELIAIKLGNIELAND